MKHVKYQWELFLLSVSFFTRIPVLHNVPYSATRMNQSGRYFPLVGALIGTITVGCYLGLTLLLPSDISLFFTMVVSLLLTGAFHEDGLADMVDGIGGGMTLERRLEIMKDSRVGTYGSAALIMALLGKFLLLKPLLNLDNWHIVFIFLVAATTSRAVACSLIFDTDYVSDINKSKSKPLAQQQTGLELAVITVFGVLPCLWFSSSIIIILLVSLVMIRFIFRRWLIKRLGGFTGDCLGALQQITELWIYTVFVVALHHSFL